MLQIDGSQGEGGGQVLRSALALSLVTAQPFQIVNIRANRRNPGLRRQHLSAVKAAATVCGARVSEIEVGTRELIFSPGEVTPGEYHFSIGSAGSTGLVLQAVLLPLLIAAAPSRIIVEGGTHNPLAPPFEFLQKAFLPLLERMGGRLSATLERPGFYPAGGGRLRVHIQPCSSLQAIHLQERGTVFKRKATALLANLPEHIARRELKIIARELDCEEDCLAVETAPAAIGKGNVVIIEIHSERVTEVFSAFGRLGIPAERVAMEAVQSARAYLAAGVAVGSHLADQLLLPMALAGGGSFSTLPLTPHARTNIKVIKQFLAIDIRIEKTSPGKYLVSLHR